MKEILKTTRFDRDINTVFKTTGTERDLIKSLAIKYTEGNLSRWIRYAALNYKPKASDFKGKP